MTRVSIQAEAQARPDRARPRDRPGERKRRVPYAILVEQIFREHTEFDPLVHRDRRVEVAEAEIALLQRPPEIDGVARPLASLAAAARLHRPASQAPDDQVRQ